MYSADFLLKVVLIGIVFGLIGQSIRVLIGLKVLAEDTKALDIGTVDIFNPYRIAISLALGALAGVLALIIAQVKEPFELNTILAIIAAGYSGGDFIESMFKALIPKPKLNVNPSNLPQVKAIGNALRRFDLNVLTSFHVERPTPITAVNQAIRESMPHAAFDEKTKLADLDFNAANLQILAAKIRNLGYAVENQKIMVMGTVGELYTYTASVS